MLTKLSKELRMTRINWDKIADKEFNEMNTEYQADWAELRNRIS